MEQPDLLSFCEEYHYSPLIREQLTRILHEIKTNCPDIISVLLFGSTARGELSYRIDSDRQISLWSDYELIAVAEKNPKKIYRTTLFNRLYALELDWSKNSPLFHIDCNYVSLNTLKHLPPLLRHYEAKTVGKTILGNNIRSEIPEITLANLDYRELAEVILWRLWAMVLYAPREWFALEREDERTKGRKDDELFSFVLCRNALDLTTYLLPWEKVLLPSFQERTKYIADNYAKLQLSKLFDEQFPQFLNACLHGKFEFKFEMTTEQIYQQTLKYFVIAGKHLLVMHGIKNENNGFTADIVKYQSRLFNEFQFRRKGYELFLISKYRAQKSISDWWHWCWQGKAGKMMVCLYHLHFALQAMRITNDFAEAQIQLNEASKLLSAISLRRLPIECDDSAIPVGARWLAIRNSFARFLMDLYQSVGAKEEYINRILG